MLIPTIKDKAGNAASAVKGKVGNAFSTVKEKVSGKLAGAGAEAVNANSAASGVGRKTDFYAGSKGIATSLEEYDQFAAGNSQIANARSVVSKGGNATKHMGEYVNSANGSLLVENELMISFQDAVSQILPKVQSGRNFFYINGWEIGINGDTGVIYHALYK